MKRVLQIPVEAGLCVLNFRPEVSTGKEGGDTSPGIGFDFIYDLELFKDEYGLQRGSEFGSGVISRSNVAKLHAMLEEFLKKHPPRKDKGKP